MPLYEFNCKKCDNTFEALLRMGSNGRGVRCPECSGKRVRRVMSRFASTSSGGKSDLGASQGGSACSSCTASSCASCK